MSIVAFDTLKLSQRLKKLAKFPQEQAEQTALVLAESFAELAGNPNLATRDDIVEVRNGVQVLRNELAAVRHTMEKLEIRLEFKMTETKAGVSRLMFWLIGLQTLVILGALLGLPHSILKI